MKKIIFILIFLLIFSGPVLAQRIGRMGVLIVDPNGRDQFVQSIDFQNTDITVGSSADVTIDLSVSAGWTQDTTNKYIYLTDANYTVGLGDETPSYPLVIENDLSGDGVATFLQLKTESTVQGDGAAIDFRPTTSDTENRYMARIAGIRAASAGSSLAFSVESGSALTEALRINRLGLLGINDNTPDGQLDITVSTAATVGLDIDGAAAQSANIVDIDDATGDALFTISSSGYVGILDDDPSVPLEVDGVIRTTNSEWYACQYINGFSVDPGASGASWTAPDSDTAGGFNLDADGEFLYFNAKVCTDWDGSSDVIIRVFWEVDDADATGDAVLDCVVYMKGDGESSTKSQSLSDTEDVSGDSQYTQHHSDFTINYDDGSNPVEANDILTCKLNFDATSSDITDIIYNFATLLYQTKKPKVEIP